jgi:hypothetical protein
MLVMFAAYQVLCFVEARTSGESIIPRSWHNFLWMANWKMFTHAGRQNTAVKIEGERDGRFRRLPMETWFPSTFGEGRYRWERSSVQRSASLQMIFLDAACKRAKNVTRTRMVRETWKRKLGRSPERRGRVRRRIVRTFRCGTPVPRATGKII